MSTATTNLTERLKAEAQRLGFALCGVCPAVEPTGISRFNDWLESGFDGQMEYLENRREAYTHPRHVLDGSRSLLMLGMHYQTESPADPQPGQGRISHYGWGDDYHDLIHDRLKQLKAFLLQEAPEANVRGVVDSAPLLEREFAQLAGLGWVGKNTMLISKHAGSWFFLAALLTDLELDYDAPHATDHCGTCTACLDACPTDAFPAPYQLDSRRCISYLTIELRDAIPTDLREPMGDWLFGCDICQQVCPWNRHAPLSEEPTFQPQNDNNPTSLVELFDLDDEQFRQRFRHTPLWRSRRRGILRNAAIVLGNQKFAAAVPALTRGLGDEEPMIRGASAWALGQIGSAAAQESLQTRREREEEPAVAAEINATLKSLAV